MKIYIFDRFIGTLPDSALEIRVIESPTDRFDKIYQTNVKILDITNDNDNDRENIKEIFRRDRDYRLVCDELIHICGDKIIKTNDRLVFEYIQN